MTGWVRSAEPGAACALAARRRARGGQRPSLRV